MPKKKMDPKNRYNMQNKKAFLTAWCRAMVVPEADYKTFIIYIRNEFDSKNEGHIRSNEQVEASIVLKARSIRKELLELGQPCPPIPTKKGNSDIVSVEQALKDEELTNLLSFWKK